MVTPTIYGRPYKIIINYKYNTNRIFGLLLLVVNNLVCYSSHLSSIIARAYPPSDIQFRFVCLSVSLSTRVSLVHDHNINIHILCRVAKYEVHVQLAQLCDVEATVRNDISQSVVLVSPNR